MKLLYIFIISIVFSVFNWVCSALMMNNEQTLPAVLFFIGSIPWSVLFFSILFAGHNHSKRR